MISNILEDSQCPLDKLIEYLEPNIDERLEMIINRRNLNDEALNNTQTTVN